MQLKRDGAELFVPDGLAVEAALARTTHLAIGAHPDDLEIMAVHGILQCFQRQDQWFTGVVVGDGSGSPRSGLYQDYTDDSMRAVRVKEQKKAAVLGEYAAQVLLDYPTATLADAANQDPVADVALILQATQPTIVYTHNLADRHDTHVAVALRVIQAARSLPQKQRPRQLYGCEVWRDLDWLVDGDRVALDCSARQNLQAALLGVFDSQISAGKRYDLATLGRRRAHATFGTPHRTDATAGTTLAMDLTPLINDPQASVQAYVQEFIERFRQDVLARLAAA